VLWCWLVAGWWRTLRSTERIARMSRSAGRAVQAAHAVVMYQLLQLMYLCASLHSRHAVCVCAVVHVQKYALCGRTVNQ
jgi:hypothetical protein